MQVEGKAGPGALAAKVRAGGPRVLYHGALAASVATFVGHYPWFVTVRASCAQLPLINSLYRNACSRRRY